mgnify:CR=1 FL=1
MFMSSAELEASRAAADPPRQKPLTAMTLEEVDAHQRGMLARGSRSSAAGKYQINRETMRWLRETMGLTGAELYTPELQERMGRERMRLAGYDEFLQGKITAEQFQERMSGVWTSIAKPDGRARNARDPVATGRDAFQDALARARIEADALKARGERLDPKGWR